MNLIDQIKASKCSLFQTPTSLGDVKAWVAKLSGTEALVANVAVGMLLNFLADNLESDKAKGKSSSRKPLTAEQKEKRRIYHQQLNAKKRAAKLEAQGAVTAELSVAELMAKAPSKVEAKAKAKAKSKSKSK